MNTGNAGNTPKQFLLVIAALALVKALCSVRQRTTWQGYCCFFMEMQVSCETTLAALRTPVFESVSPFFLWSSENRELAQNIYSETWNSYSWMSCVLVSGWKKNKLKTKETQQTDIALELQSRRVSLRTISFEFFRPLNKMLLNWTSDPWRPHIRATQNNGA